ncbi:c-type cytochrome [Chitiniphilus purpureus]|uniref:C-type cytochrome n=1 Tax=Chitiniphilus purpureus TaxID=2981137 RepID=A0ABY6DN91_9NEIS|nr:c-type cytochrome [Chitiniphilus sp. CD1]UXY15678.1 c-type cytochrome [Chitiniphilus sp. CD1]
MDSVVCHADGDLHNMRYALICKRRCVMRVLGLMVLALAATGSAAAENGAAVAAKYNCLACHAVDHKIVGPSYRDIAKKYRGQKGAEAVLMAKVRHGGGGVWGKIPMPPQQIGEADLRTIVRWVLAQ